MEGNKIISIYDFYVDVFVIENNDEMINHQIFSSFDDYNLQDYEIFLTLLNKINCSVKDIYFDKKGLDFSLKIKKDNL